MVTTLAAQLPVTIAGNPANVAPVAPVVAYFILVMGVLITTDCALVPTADVKVAVLLGVTVIVPDHKEITIGTLGSIIRQSGLPRSLFEKAF